MVKEASRQSSIIFFCGNIEREEGGGGSTVASCLRKLVDVS